MGAEPHRRDRSRESPKKEHAVERALFKSVSETQEGGAKICPVDSQSSEKSGKGASLCRTMLTNVPYP